jgi:hypothetical protein
LVAGPELMLEATAAQTMAVTLHELAINAAKFGALSVANGRVQVTWSRAADGLLILRWTETDGPPVKPPTRYGFGTRVMEDMIRSQLKGEIVSIGEQKVSPARSRYRLRGCLSQGEHDRDVQHSPSQGFGGGGTCFSSQGRSGSKQAHLGALEVQMVICGLPRSGSSRVPARMPI